MPTDPHALPATSGVRVAAGLFLLSAATLLLEIALTRAFAVVFWSHLTPMVVGTALFGFSVSGLYAHFFERPSRATGLMLAFVVAVLVLLAVASRVPLRIWDFEGRRLELDAGLLALYELALLAPFSFAGLAILRLLSSNAYPLGRLYAADLAGAAAGCLLLLPLLPRLGGEGTIVASAGLGSIAAVVVAEGTGARVIAAVVAVAVLLGSPWASELFPLLPHQTKRAFNEDVESGRLLHTEWTALSRVDVSAATRRVRRIWIDGGTNESAMIRHADSYFPPGSWAHASRDLPYRLKRGRNARALVIGPAGGAEVHLALASGAAHVDAVEMDAGVVHVVRDLFDDFLGGLYQDPRVRLVNDEGRSFLRRGHDRYDVIQSVNNYTPAALFSGALNLSESYLLTKEAFHEYLDHLTPDGVVAFHRGATLRIAAMAAEVLEERGVTDPGARIAVVEGVRPIFDVFLLKNAPFDEGELDLLKEYSQRTRAVIRYLPGGSGERLFVKMISSPDRVTLYRSLGVDLTPPTDDAPFLDHYGRFGQQRLASDLPYEFHFFERLKWWKRIPRGDVAYVAILAESALLAVLLLGLPLAFAPRGRSSVRAPVLCYFSCLGAGFILVELCLTKTVVLFLGHPTYSVSVVLFTLLLGAAMGSLLSMRVRALRPALACVVGALIVEAWAMPAVFHAALGLPFAGRIAIAIVMLSPLGVALGVPFPGALRALQENAPAEIPLAWAMNGYATVVGSGVTALLAASFGFRATYLTACALYAIAATVAPRVGRFSLSAPPRVW